MWLSGMSRPDHNTIFRFRSKRLKGEIKKIFAMVVALLVEEGLISIKEAFIDGTKIEANANRYTFVWGNAIKTNKEKIKEQLKELWAYVEQVCKEEKEQLEKPDFTELSPEKLEATIDTINKALAEKKVDKIIKQKIRYAAKNWGTKLKEYQAKDTTDTSMFIKHYEEFNQLHNTYPKEITGDAGFGSEENYEFLEDKDISPFVKFNYFHKEQTKKWKKEWFRLENLYYNQKQDCFYCPMGQKMKKIGESEKRTKTGCAAYTSLSGN